MLEDWEIYIGIGIGLAGRILHDSMCRFTSMGLLSLGLCSMLSEVLSFPLPCARDMPPSITNSGCDQRASGSALASHKNHMRYITFREGKPEHNFRL